MNKGIRFNAFIITVVLVCLHFNLDAVRLRFILINNTGSNLFACLRTHDCNPLNEAEMRPGEAENIYTENFKAGITRFVFMLQTNNELRKYEVVYNNQAKTLQLQRNGIVFQEISYNAGYAEYPPVIVIGSSEEGKEHTKNYGKLDAYFDNDALYDTQKITGMNTANSTGYRPSTYLGDSGPITLRKDQNRFCGKYTPCRKDLARLSSYVGICRNETRHDNLKPFCRKKQICWRSYRMRNCTKKCS